MGEENLISESNLLQIEYCCGDPLKTHKTIGTICVIGQPSIKRSIMRQKLKLNKYAENTYLVEGTMVEVPPEHFEGELYLRLVGNSKKSLEETAKKLKLPFNEKTFVVPYMMGYRKEFFGSDELVLRLL